MNHSTREAHLHSEHTGRIDIKTWPFVIGRNSHCSLVLEDPSVSREHARIAQTDDGFTLEDLESRHGTFLNGRRIDGTILLRDQDEIRVSRNALTFHVGSAEPQTITVSTMTAVVDSQQLVAVRPESKLRALHEIISNLRSTVHVDELLSRILDSVLHIFPHAQTGSILFLDESTKEFVPHATRNRTGPAGDPRISRTVVERAIAEKQAILSKDAYLDSQFSGSESISLYGIHSVICAPLLSQDQSPLGVLHVHSEEQRASFDEEDLSVLVSVANATAMAIENARLHEEELARERFQRETQFARDVQRRFLPARSPDIPGYRFYSYYESARSVGGDYFGFIKLPDHRLAIALGDVSGKGMPAALLMARLSSDVRYAVLTSPDPAKSLQSINQALSESEIDDKFVTLLLMVLDESRHLLTIANAGHWYPLLRHPDGRTEEIGREDAGLPLNITDDPDYTYPTTLVELEAGSSVLAVTDGVTEARNADGELFGSERLREQLSAGPSDPEEAGRSVINAVVHFCGREPRYDDTTLVCFGRQEVES